MASPTASPTADPTALPALVAAAAAARAAVVAAVAAALAVAVTAAAAATAVLARHRAAARLLDARVGSPVRSGSTASLLRPRWAEGRAAPHRAGRSPPVPKVAPYPARHPSARKVRSHP
eukprot:scaffold124734_cov63-Phaeocystis_antarctica.AAC.4